MKILALSRETLRLLNASETELVQAALLAPGSSDSPKESCQYCSKRCSVYWSGCNISC